MTIEEYIIMATIFTIIIQVGFSLPFKIILIIKRTIENTLEGGMNIFKSFIKKPNKYYKVK